MEDGPRSSAVLTPVSHTQTRQRMRTHCTEQGTQGSAVTRRDICVRTADSLCCTGETNTALGSNFTPIKKKKRVVFTAGAISMPRASVSVLINHPLLQSSVSDGSTESIINKNICSHNPEHRDNHVYNCRQLAQFLKDDL